MEKKKSKNKVIYIIPKLSCKEIVKTSSTTFEKVVDITSEECRKVEIIEIDQSFVEKIKLN